jgi:hypothetical protein
MKSIVTLLPILLIFVSASVFGASNCAENSVAFGNLQIDVLSTSKGCTMSSHPVDEPDAYRAVTLGERGIVQIFNKYDVAHATNSNSTGSRSFFVFPRAQIPSFIPPVSEGGDVKLIASSGDIIEIKPGKRAGSDGSGETLNQIVSSDAVTFQLKEDAAIVTSNNGGVDIKLSPDSHILLLDCGFAMGGVAFTKPARSSTFYDGKGNHCTVLNSTIFNFANYDADLKWKDDESLFQHLKTACPTLSLPDLTPAATDDESDRRPAHAHGGHGH